MRPSVRDGFVEFTAPIEGVVPWLYLDVKGLVTTAIGNLVDPMISALSLPWVSPNGEPASRDEIAKAWMAVKSRPELARQGFRVAAQFTTIRLTPEGIQKVVSSKLEQMGRYLTTRFPEFESWPGDAQLGTLSMAWACGPAFRFDTLADALRAKNFGLAAMTCQIRTEGNTGVIPRNKANQILFRNAACVVAQGLDPCALYWPRDLAGEPDTQPELVNPPSEPPPPPTTADMPTVYPKPEDGK